VRSSILRVQSGCQRGSGTFWGVIDNNGGLRTGSCGEEGNAHSPPDIRYGKEPTKGKRLMRRPPPSQEPAGETEADAAKKQSAGGDSAILRGQSGRERCSGRLYGVGVSGLSSRPVIKFPCFLQSILS